MSDGRPYPYHDEPNRYRPNIVTIPAFVLFFSTYIKHESISSYARFPPFCTLIFMVGFWVQFLLDRLGLEKRNRARLLGMVESVAFDVVVAFVVELAF
ncbi:hypothetical protein Hanom_Chr03g00252531 [Helianthus anomalus]